MIEEKVLQDIGLTEIEAKVYLAALTLGQATVLNIAKKAEIKRPTGYVTLDGLSQKGFVSKLEKKSTTLYSAENPRIILNKYKEKIANFTELLPYFEAQASKGAKPKIKYYEGQEELMKIYTQVIFPSAELYFFGSDVEKLNDILPNLLPNYQKYFNTGHKEVKELVSNNPAGLKYLNLNSKNRQIRVMPKNLPVFADSAITENKIFIVSLENLFGILIESDDLAKTYKNFFLLAWKSAEQA